LAQPKVYEAEAKNYVSSARQLKEKLDRGASESQYIQSAEETAQKGELFLQATTTQYEQGLQSNSLEAVKDANTIFAQAISDLSLSVQLLQETAPSQGPVEKSARVSFDLDGVFDYIEETATGATPSDESIEKGGGETPIELSRQLTSTHKAIFNRTVIACKDSFTKISRSGVAELLSDFGTAIGETLDRTALGDSWQALLEPVKKLLQNVEKAFETLFGSSELVAKAVEKLKSWLKDFSTQKAIKFILTELYNTEVKAQELVEKIKINPVDKDKSKAAYEALVALNNTHKKQIDWINTLTGVPDTVMRFTKLDSAIPPLKAILITGYGLALAYVVYLGADFLDSPNLEMNFKAGLEAIIKAAYL